MNTTNKTPVPTPPQPMSTDTKTIIVVLLLLFAYPVGIVFMWLWMKHWPSWLRILLTSLLVLPVLAVLAVLSLIFIFAASSGEDFYRDTPDRPRRALPSASPSAREVVCTQEAKLCPDGTYVGRVPPSCEFATCPGQ